MTDFVISRRALVAATASTGVVMALGAMPRSAVAAPLSTEEALAERVLGAADAPVTMLEYSSLTCPHCASFHVNTLPILKEKYIDTGKLQIVYRDFPLDRAGAIAAMMARCVPTTSYFPVLDVLFKNQRGWAGSEDPVGALARIGAQAGLGIDDFNACLQNQQLLDGVLRMRQEGSQKFEITSTPTFIVNDSEKIAGAQDVSVFEAAIEKFL